MEDESTHHDLFGDVRKQCVLDADPDYIYDEKEITKDEITKEDDTFSLKLKHEDYDTAINSAAMEEGDDSKFEFIGEVNKEITTGAAVTIKYKLKDGVDSSQVYDEEITITDKYGTESKIDISNNLKKVQDNAPENITATKLINGQAKIRGVTTAMEYKRAADAVYTAVTEAQATDGIVVTETGDYYIRYKANDEYSAGQYKAITVEKEIPSSSSSSSSKKHKNSEKTSEAKDDSNSADKNELQKDIKVADSNITIVNKIENSNVEQEKQESVIKSVESVAYSITAGQNNIIGNASNATIEVKAIENIKTVSGNTVTIAEVNVNNVPAKLISSDTADNIAVTLNADEKIFVFVKELGSYMEVSTQTVGNNDVFKAEQGSLYVVGNKDQLKVNTVTDGWNQINGKWYIANKNGQISKGWAQVGSKWYYLDDKTGEMKTGWVKYNGIWFYFEYSGEMAVGWIQVDDKWYYLNSNGSMACNTVTPDGYKVGADGAWIA